MKYHSLDVSATCLGLTCKHFYKIYKDHYSERWHIPSLNESEIYHDDSKIRLADLLKEWTGPNIVIDELLNQKFALREREVLRRKYINTCFRGKHAARAANAVHASGKLDDKKYKEEIRIFQFRALRLELLMKKFEIDIDNWWGW